MKKSILKTLHSTIQGEVLFQKEFYQDIHSALTKDGIAVVYRLVAFDTTNTLVVALLVVLAIMFNQVVFVDVAIVYAVLSFIMTLYIARFIEGKKF